jgi:hypothetical protein
MVREHFEAWPGCLASSCSITSPKYSLKALAMPACLGSSAACPGRRNALPPCCPRCCSPRDRAQQVLKRIKPKLLINNEFVDSVTGKTFTSWDPRSGEAMLEVAEAQAQDVDRAVKAAKKVARAWGRVGARRRVEGGSAGEGGGGGGPWGLLAVLCRPGVQGRFKS